ncbi:MAG: DUF1559 domain-containing protein [Verrucomicrobiales bacterium]|nr:DUF1559 domain-containing protein [Verrucomicrobiales bacterium]
MKSPASSPTRSAAFTLVELLVVIAIIGVLASLLLPSLSKAKAAAKNTFCKNNLRQLGIALNLYTTDFERYPAAGFPLTLPNGLFTVPYLSETPWFHVVLTYAGDNADLLYCPANPTSFRIKKYPKRIDPGAGIARGSYGYNVMGTGFLPYLNRIPPELVLLGLTPNAATGLNTLGPVLPASAVKVPSDMIAVGDSQSDGTNDFTITTAVASGSSLPLQAWPGKRHGRGANIVFCDGHLEQARQKKWLERTPDVLRRWNRDNEPHLDSWGLAEGSLLKYAE